MPVNERSTIVGIDQPPQRNNWFWSNLLSLVFLGSNDDPGTAGTDYSSFSFIIGDAVTAENLPSLPIPEVRGDKIFVKISEDLYEEQLKLFRTNLIGRLLLRKGSIPLRTDTIKTSLDVLWKPSNSWHLVPLGRGFFDIHFDSEADMKRIWNGGTCVLNNGLSQDYWHPRILMGIANGIGTPLQIDKATKERQFGYYARILVDIDLSKDHPTSLIVERGNHAFLVAIDYETSLDKLKNIHAKERPRSRSRKRGYLSDHLVGDRLPHHQEYRVKVTSVNVPLLDQQGLRNTHGETPLVSHHVEIENRFAICYDPEHIYAFN
ncbi:hypothetical protein M0R45_030324 [Rubus argutus]|uniref:DUF4283 domain-containing protein n=1 Tax=Rubus argutus TaxID=59490 RepID=A0AAW1WCM7_RUBAR